MKVMHIFFDTHLGRGHAGLMKLLKAKKLEAGFAVFINKKWSALKMLTPSNVLLHYKSPSDARTIDPDTIKYLPSCIGSDQTLQYDKALGAVLEKRHLEKIGVRHG
jgi:hypothetical protein